MKAEVKDMDQESRIENLGTIELMGVAIYGNAGTTAFCTAWELFGEVADEASLSRIGKDIYGLQIYHPRFPEEFTLTYMACLVREPEMELPARMLAKTLPGSGYAVQTVSGGTPGIDDALKHLYQDFIPGHGLKVSMPFDFERYCDVQDHESSPDKIEIWVPVSEA